MIVERRGALSAHAHEITGIFLSPVELLGITDLYIDLLFPAIFGVSVIGGTLVATRLDAGLPAGLAVGFLSTSYFVPGEHRILPFLVLVLLLSVPIYRTVTAKVVMFSVTGLAAYWELTGAARGGSILGLTSEHAAYIGIESSTGVLFFLLQIVALLGFAAVLYRIERSEWSWSDGVRDSE